MDDEGSAALEAHLGEHEPAHVRTVSEILQTKGHVKMKLFLGPRETCRAGQRTPHTPARRHQKIAIKDHKQRPREKEMNAMPISSVSLSVLAFPKKLFCGSQRGGHAYQLF